MDGRKYDVGKQKRVSARVQRILKKREPQIIESTKRCMILKGHHTSETITDVLQDFGKLLKPNCVVLDRKNEILPFEDSNSIEFLSQKNDTSLFILGSHTKKRPNNLVMVKFFFLVHIRIFIAQVC
jgi:ribosome production factor 2